MSWIELNWNSSRIELIYFELPPKASDREAVRRRSRPTPKASDHEVVRFEIAISRDGDVVRRWFLRNWIRDTILSFSNCNFSSNFKLTTSSSKLRFRTDDFVVGPLRGRTTSWSDHFVVRRLRRRAFGGIELNYIVLNWMELIFRQNELNWIDIISSWIELI